jgi:hypothetical protein
MTSTDPPQLIGDDEILARFVMRREWIRSDDTVRPDAFIPPRDLNLSVTRHAGLSGDQLWHRGHGVASLHSKPLLGRADIRAASVRKTESSSMNVIPAPLPENVQHAHIVGWPSEKPRQKHIAQQLAVTALLVRSPAAQS